MQTNPEMENAATPIKPMIQAVRSMTGYGRAQQLVDNREITVEIRSVNHRFFEYSARVPRAYASLEEKLKSAVKESCSRGKIELSLSIQPVKGEALQVKINRELAASTLKALRELANELQVRDDVTVTELAKFGDIFTITKASEADETAWEAVEAVLQEALAQFIGMREAEGLKMEQDLLSRLELIEELVSQVEEISPRTVEAYRVKLTAKIQELLQGTAVEEQRLVTETAIFAEKIAVAEETVRLKSHIHQFRQILQSGEPLGRKLDFLVQEFNREANTIGSKAQDLQIARIVVDLKSEIEKIREQVQNME